MIACPGFVAEAVEENEKSCPGLAWHQSGHASEDGLAAG
jgi:hypothetical protein